MLLISNIFLSKKMHYQISLSALSGIDTLFMGTASIFPILAIFGAISLNNNSSNLLIMILISLIPITLLGLVLFEKNLNEHTYYWYILMASISLLLMLSLRSWHISGWDIN